MQRRDLLAVTGVSIAGVFAGCTSSDDDGGNGGNGDDEGNGNGGGNGGGNGNTSDENGDENGGGNGNGNGGEAALYDESDDLLLDVGAFADENDPWVRDDEINPRFDAVFRSDDESILVLLSVEAFADVDEAIDDFERVRLSVADANEYPIADEAFWAINDGLAVTVFRHSNAMGGVYAVRESGFDTIPDTTRSQTYAQLMFEGWPN